MLVAQGTLADTATYNSDPESTPRKLTNVMETRSQTAFARMGTAWNSFRVLKGLTQQQIDNFMKSYVIYDLDWKDEKMMTETLGPDYQKRVGECLSDYYSVLNHMCALGELEKMYIPPVMDLSANIFTNQILYEESIAEELQLPENARVFDLGCGRGRVAAHMHLLTGATVTGLNIDHDQVASAIAFNEENQFPNNFVRRDMNDLPLPFSDGEFDGFYQIQAFSLCKDIPKLCSELYRVLKPGARLSLLDWASLDAFDPTDPHHRDLMRKIKPVIGAVGTPTPQSLKEDLESAGFKVLRTNNASIDGLQSPLIESAEFYFRTIRYALKGLVMVGLLPAHLTTIFERFAQDGDAFIEADKGGLITTSYHWLAEKPKDGHQANGHLKAALKPDTMLSGDISNSTELSPPFGPDNSTPDSASSSDEAIMSPSPARSSSTGITEPPILPTESMKTGSQHVEAQLHPQM